MRVGPQIAVLHALLALRDLAVHERLDLAAVAVSIVGCDAL